MLNRREFIQKAGIAATAVVLGSKGFAQTKSSKPNVLFLMTDQQQHNAMRVAGNLFIRTPNMDRLATMGVRFTHAHSPYPVCGPCRSATLTGRTAQNTGITSNKDDDMREKRMGDAKTYDEALVEAGYVAEYYGKWHSPTGHRFCYNNVITPASGHWDFGPSMLDKWRKEVLDPNVKLRPTRSGELIDTFSLSRLMKKYVDIKTFGGFCQPSLLAIRI
jgi:arylsulfatase A-like enzyme